MEPKLKKAFLIFFVLASSLFAQAQRPAAGFAVVTDSMDVMPQSRHGMLVYAVKDSSLWYSTGWQYLPLRVADIDLQGIHKDLTRFTITNDTIFLKENNGIAFSQDNDSLLIGFESTSLHDLTFGDNTQASFTWTFDLTPATDPAITFSNSSIDISPGILSQSGIPVVLSVREITTTAPLTGGGDLYSNLELGITQNIGTDITADLEEEIHASEHENGGDDEIDVSGLSGELADPQNVQLYDDGTIVPATYPKINFISGSNATVSVASDVANDRYNVTIGSTGETYTEGNYIDIASNEISFDPTELGTATFGDNTQASFSWTFDLSPATDPIITFSNGVVDFSPGIIKQGGIPVVLSVREITTTAPLTGGGDLYSNLELGITQHSGTDITVDLEEETHAAEHENGGSDEISVSGLSGTLADIQNIQLYDDGSIIPVTWPSINFQSGSNISITASSDAGNSRYNVQIAATNTTYTAGNYIDISSNQIDFDPTELNDVTWGDDSDASIVWTFDIGGIGFNPAITFSSSSVDVSTGILSQSGIPVVLAVREVTTTSPLAGGGDLYSNVELSLNQNAGTDVTADLEEETHASEHQDGGTDEINVAGLSGELADPQKIQLIDDGVTVPASWSDLNFESGDNIAITVSSDGANSRYNVKIDGSPTLYNPGTGIDIGLYTISFDATEINDVTWGAGITTTIDWEFDAISGVDPILSFGNGVVNITNSELQEQGVRVVTQSRTLTAGTGLSGGGDLSANRTFNFAATELGNLTWGNNSVSSFSWTFDLTPAIDPAITFSNSSIDISPGILSQGGIPVVLNIREITTTAPLTGGGDLSSNLDLGFDPTGLSNATWGNNTASSFTWTFDLTPATDPAITFSSSSVDISPGILSQGGVPVVLAIREITTTAPLTGGGDLYSNLDLGINQNVGTDITADLEEESHASEHQNGGADEINVAGLSGTLADPQNVQLYDDGSIVPATWPRINFESGSNISITATSDGANSRYNVKIDGASVGAPTNAYYVVTQANGTLTNEVVTNAGTDVTADLEEENHHAEHESTGGDQINVQGLLGVLQEPQIAKFTANGANPLYGTTLNFADGTGINITNSVGSPAGVNNLNVGVDLAVIENEDHASEHQDGGNDEIIVTGLSGVLADPQKMHIWDDGVDIGSTQAINFISGSGIDISFSYGATLSAMTITSTLGAGYAPSDAHYVVTVGDVDLANEHVLTAGNYIDVSTATVSFDPTEVNDVTWGDNTDASIVWTFDIGGVGFNPAITFSSSSVDVSTGILSQSGIPVVLAVREITTTAPLAGGGDLYSNVDLTLNHHSGTDITADLEEENHSVEHENGGNDEIDVTGLSGILGQAQNINAYSNTTNLGYTRGIDLQPGANITITPAYNATVTAYYISTTGLETENHASEHQNGGADEINVEGLSGLLADAQKSNIYEDGNLVSTQKGINIISGSLINVSGSVSTDRVNITIDGDANIEEETHAAEHANGGNDELNVAGLSGTLADAQNIQLYDDGSIIPATWPRVNFQSGTDISIVVSSDAVNSRYNVQINSTATTGAPADANYVVTSSDATLTNEHVLTAGNYIDVSTATISFDPTELSDATWGDASQATIDWTFNASTGTDPILSFGNGVVNISNSQLQEQGTRVVTQARTISTTSPITGGGALSSNLTLALSQNAGTNIANDLEEENHSTEHENGGNDEIVVDGLSGVLAEAQNVQLYDDGSIVPAVWPKINFQSGTNTTVTVSSDGANSRYNVQVNASSGAPADAHYVVTATNGTLTNEHVLTEGSYIDISTATISFDPTELNDVTWGNDGDPNIAWTFDVSDGTSPQLVFGDNQINVNIGTLKQGGTAVALQSRTISTTAPLTGGGDLSANRTLGITTTGSGSAVVMQNYASIYQPTITWAYSASPGQTSEARPQWDSDDDVLVVGTGSSNVKFWRNYTQVISQEFDLVTGGGTNTQYEIFVATGAMKIKKVMMKFTVDLVKNPSYVIAWAVKVGKVYNNGTYDNDYLLSEVDDNLEYSDHEYFIWEDTDFLHTDIAEGEEVAVAVTGGYHTSGKVKVIIEFVEQ